MSQPEQTVRRDASIRVESLRFVRDCLAGSYLRSEAAFFDPAEAPIASGFPLALDEAFEAIGADFDRFHAPHSTPEEVFARLPLAPTLLATYLYRLCRALHRRHIVRAPDVLAALARHLTGVEIYYSADIGPGLKIIHGLGTVLGAACRIGRNFTVYQNVTVGDKLGRQTGPRPVIGDRVIASAGCQILGPVEIGDETVIGANAVVLQSLPSRCVAVGAPARVRVANLSDQQFDDYWSSLKG